MAEKVLPAAANNIPRTSCKHCNEHKLDSYLVLIMDHAMVLCYK